MEWLLSGGELLVGVVVLALGWLLLKFFSGDATTKLSNMRFALLPILFMLWFVGGGILVLLGLRLL